MTVGSDATCCKIYPSRVPLVSLRDILSRPLLVVAPVNYYIKGCVELYDTVSDGGSTQVEEGDRELGAPRTSTSMIPSGKPSFIGGPYACPPSAENSSLSLLAVPDPAMLIAIPADVRLRPIPKSEGLLLAISHSLNPVLCPSSPTTRCTQHHPTSLHDAHLPNVSARQPNNNQPRASALSSSPLHCPPLHRPDFPCASRAVCPQLRYSTVVVAACVSPSVPLKGPLDHPSRGLTTIQFHATTEPSRSLPHL